MAADFPATLATIQRVLPGDRQDAPGKEADLLHNQICDELEALQAKVGIDGSSIATSLDKRMADAETAGSAATAHAAAASPHSGHSTPASVSAAIASAISTNGLIGYVPQAGGNAGRFILSPYDGAEAALSNVLIETTSSDPYSSHIGTKTIKPPGVSGTNSDPNAATDSIMGTPWAVDSSYVDAFAGVSTIVGGYDHVNNQLAGTIVGGGHNYIQYNVNGHSSIIGGANNRIDGARSSIIGGSSCTVNGGATFGVVVGGEYNTCQGSRSAIISGLSNQIISTATYSAIVSGRSNKIDTGSITPRSSADKAIRSRTTMRSCWAMTASATPWAR